MLEARTRVLLIIIIVFLIYTTREDFTQESEEPSIYILTRTSGRPTFFNNCRNSLKKQKFRNWVHLISTDDEESYKYATCDKDRATVAKVNKIQKDKHNNCPYNLYLNKLIELVPVGAWIIFLDDDGIMTTPNSLNDLSVSIKNAETAKKDMVLSKITYGPKKYTTKPHCWGKSMKEIRDLIKNDWWSCRIDTAMLAIKKKPNMQLWESQCAGDVRFLNNNIQQSDYEILFNPSPPIISANYSGQGKGTRKDLTQ